MRNTEILEYIHGDLVQRGFFPLGAFGFNNQASGMSLDFKTRSNLPLVSTRVITDNIPINPKEAAEKFRRRVEESVTHNGIASLFKETLNLDIYTQTRRFLPVGLTNHPEIINGPSMNEELTTCTITLERNVLCRDREYAYLAASIDYRSKEEMMLFYMLFGEDIVAVGDNAYCIVKDNSAHLGDQLCRGVREFAPRAKDSAINVMRPKAGATEFIRLAAGVIAECNKKVSVF
jgi:hypothetical protein